ncbi:MAG: HupE/UreJ family protein [Candidatus Eisenbacteria bacterium]|nr:HupE/UreJ family protein [Candidatus Eisenbacteria bacterium]
MDPDHVVAVAALTARTRSVLRAAWLGVIWGLGHTLTLFAVGSAIILLNLTLPPRAGLAFEFVVALALVIVGALNLGRAAWSDDRLSAPCLPASRTFAVGLAHGLAGSAAVALLVLATARNPREACAYLLVFGLGTLCGMAMITTAFAAPLSVAVRRWPSFGRSARVATGGISLALGAWLILHIAFVDGLFLAHARWIPR